MNFSDPKDILQPGRLYAGKPREFDLNKREDWEFLFPTGPFEMRRVKYKGLEEPRPLYVESVDQEKGVVVLNTRPPKKEGHQ